MNIDIQTGFTLKVCGKCGVNFWIPDELEAECRKTGQGWHCPNGHSRAYIESDADKYKRLYEQSEIYRKNAVARGEQLQKELAACKKPRVKRSKKAK